MNWQKSLEYVPNELVLKTLFPDNLLNNLIYRYFGWNTRIIVFSTINVYKKKHRYVLIIMILINF